MTLHMDKKIIRKEMLNRRNELTKDELISKSEMIFYNLLKIEDFQNSKELLTFINVNSEVITNSMVNYFWRKNRFVAAPKVIGKDMFFYYFSSYSQLKKGYFNIYEPLEKNEYIEDELSKDDVIIMPGLAFDRNGNRIGYGGGFYDKYLSKFEHKKIAVAFDFQIIDNIKGDLHDIKPDYIVTDKEIICIKENSCKRKEKTDERN